MKIDDLSTLTQFALKLYKIDQLSVKAVINKDIKELSLLISQYSSIKKEIKTKLIKHHYVEIQDHKAKEILQKISHQEPLLTDKIIEHLSKKSIETLELDELDEEEINSLGSEFLYSWFSHYEYIRNLYSISSLILGISIPNQLKQLVTEARLCYAFERTYAVCSLCRTILEVVIKDICVRGQLLQSNKKGNLNFDDYSTKDLRDTVSDGDLNDDIKNLYRKTSSVIHGNKDISIEVISTFKQTIKIVQKLYTKHELILEKR